VGARAAAAANKHVSVEMSVSSLDPANSVGNGRVRKDCSNDCSRYRETVFLMSVFSGPSHQHLKHGLYSLRRFKLVEI